MKKKARNASSMKQGNMLDIIDIIRRERVSRAVVARKTGLTRAAVTIIVDRLKSESILFESQGDAGRKAKKSILLDVRDDSFYFMGVDITRANCAVGIIDIKGNIVSQTGFDLVPGASYYSVLPSISDAMQGEFGAMAHPERLEGIGVSVPGPVDPHTGVVLNPPNFAMLQGKNVLDQLRGILDAPVWVDNNAVARTLYEKYVGLGVPHRNFMVMIVDTGVGSGLVLDGRLYRGTGYAGEFGHTSIHMKGNLCSCGNRGCLELYAAIPALLGRECAGRPDMTSWKAVVDGAETGDAHAHSVIKKEAQYLAQGIVNAANLLDLEAVILTGDITYRPAILVDELNRLIRNSRITSGIHGLSILASASGRDAGMASAAMIAMDKFLTGQTGWSMPS